RIQGVGGCAPQKGVEYIFQGISRRQVSRDHGTRTGADIGRDFHRLRGTWVTVPGNQASVKPEALLSQGEGDAEMKGPRFGRSSATDEGNLLFVGNANSVGFRLAPGIHHIISRLLEI